MPNKSIYAHHNNISTDPSDSGFSRLCYKCPLFKFEPDRYFSIVPVMEEDAEGRVRLRIVRRESVILFDSKVRILDVQE